MRKRTAHSTLSSAEGNVLSLRRRTATLDGPDPVDRHVGGQLRLRRAQAGMTQTDLGVKLGLSFQAVQKYETGENRVSASRLYQMARILDVSPAYFFAGLDDGGEAPGRLPKPAGRATIQGRSPRRSA